MASCFSSHFWNREELWVPNSEFRRLLKGLPETEGLDLSLVSVQCLGLLWCQGSLNDKSEELFALINGREQATDKVKCNDKNWVLVLSTLLEIAAKSIIDFTY